MHLTTFTGNRHARQFVKFVLVGILTTAINFGVYASLVVLDVPYLLAATVAFAVATINSYTWNRIWTFRAGKHRHIRLLKFTIVQLIGLSVNLIILALLVEHVSMNKFVAQLVANVFVVATNFTGNKFWTFRE